MQYAPAAVPKAAPEPEETPVADAVMTAAEDEELVPLEADETGATKDEVEDDDHDVNVGPSGRGRTRTVT